MHMFHPFSYATVVLSNIFRIPSPLNAWTWLLSLFYDFWHIFVADGDATQSFEDVGHSSTATSMMEGYLIGTLEGLEDTGDSTNAQNPPVGDGAIRNKALLQKKQPTSAGIADFIVPILVLAMAFGAWYYLTFINVKA